jgi:hypothetical protein
MLISIHKWKTPRLWHARRGGSGTGIFYRIQRHLLTFAKPSYQIRPVLSIEMYFFVFTMFYLLILFRLNMMGGEGSTGEGQIVVNLR